MNESFYAILRIENDFYFDISFFSTVSIRNRLDGDMLDFYWFSIVGCKFNWFPKDNVCLLKYF